MLGRDLIRERENFENDIANTLGGEEFTILNNEEYESEGLSISDRLLIVFNTLPRAARYYNCTAMQNDVSTNLSKSLQ